jgi:hypothetical protein
VQLGVMDRKDVQAVAGAATGSLGSALAAMPTGPQWKTHLKLDEVERALAAGRPLGEAERNRMAEIARTFDQVSRDTRYQAVSDNWGFRTLHASLQELVLPPAAYGPRRVGTSVDLLRAQLGVLPGGGAWMQALYIDELAGLYLPWTGAAHDHGHLHAHDHHWGNGLRLMFILNFFDTIVLDPYYAPVAGLPEFQALHAGLSAHVCDLVIVEPGFQIPDLAVVAAFWGGGAVPNQFIDFVIENQSASDAPAPTKIVYRTPFSRPHPWYGHPSFQTPPFRAGERRTYRISLAPGETEWLNSGGAPAGSPVAWLRIRYRGHELTRENNGMAIPAGIVFDETAPADFELPPGEPLAVARAPLPEDAAPAAPDEVEFEGIDYVGLNPQPEPPSDFMSLNPQPEPPSSTGTIFAAMAAAPKRPAGSSAHEAQLADGVVGAIRAKDLGSLRTAWDDLRDSAQGYTPQWSDVALSLLREAVVDDNEQLSQIAEEAQADAELEQQVLAHLGELAEVRSTLDDESAVDVETIEKAAADGPGGKPVVVWKKRHFDAAELDAHIEALAQQAQALTASREARLENSEALEPHSEVLLAALKSYETMHAAVSGDEAAAAEPEP